MTSKSVQQRIMLALFFAQGLFTAAIITSFTLSPIIAADLAGRDGAAGFPSTMTLLGRAVIAYPAGWLMDRIGRRLGLSLGFLLGIAGAIVSIVAVLQGAFIGFLFGAFLLGGLRGIAEQGRFVAAEVYPVAKRARAIGIVVFAGTVGAIGGPLLVGPSEQWVLQRGLAGGAGPFAAAAILLFIALLIIFLLLRPDPLHIGHALEEQTLANRPAQTERAELPLQRLRVIFQRPALRLAVLAMSLSQLVMTMLMVMTPVHMDHYDHSTSVISWVIMGHTVGMFGLSGLNGRLLSHVGRLPMIIVGTIVLIVSALLTPFAVNVPLLALALFLLGLGWNLCFVAGSALLAEAITALERGRVQGASETFVALASGVGSVGAGWLFEISGMLALSVISIAICVVLLGATIIAALSGHVRALPADTLTDEIEYEPSLAKRRTLRAGGTTE